MKDILLKFFSYSEKLNKENFLKVLEKNPSSKLLDLGCGDGDFTINCAETIGTNDIWGVEISETSASKAEKKGINVIRHDLNARLPFEDCSFDVLTANQVIEHLANIDSFMEEVYRLLKPNGYAVISTENLSSWHNIFALLFGFRPFSMHYSSKIQLGNPLSPHVNEEIRNHSMMHTRILTYYSLRDLFLVYNFKVESLSGAGHYFFPFPVLMKIASRLDPLHTHFITIKGRKSL